MRSVCFAFRLFAVSYFGLCEADTRAVIASLTARANAVKMLHARISLLKAYLNSLPPSYLTSPSGDDPTPDPPTSTSQPPSSIDHQELNHPLLRSTLALLSRLPLLLPTSDILAYKQETLAEQSDAELVNLLGTLGGSVKDARELGRKFGVVEAARAAGRKNAFGGGGMGMSGGFGEDWEGAGEGMLE